VLKQTEPLAAEWTQKTSLVLSLPHTIWNVLAIVLFALHALITPSSLNHQQEGHKCATS
jgi:hypothetical protein